MQHQRAIRAGAGNRRGFDIIGRKGALHIGIAKNGQPVGGGRTKYRQVAANRGVVIDGQVVVDIDIGGRHIARHTDIAVEGAVGGGQITREGAVIRSNIAGHAQIAADTGIAGHGQRIGGNVARIGHAVGGGCPCHVQITAGVDIVGQHVAALRVDIAATGPDRSAIGRDLAAARSDVPAKGAHSTAAGADLAAFGADDPAFGADSAAAGADIGPVGIQRAAIVGAFITSRPRMNIHTTNRDLGLNRQRKSECRESGTAQDGLLKAKHDILQQIGKECRQFLSRSGDVIGSINPPVRSRPGKRPGQSPLCAKKC